MRDVRRILVPIDFSPCSAAAVETAIPLGKALGATVDLLHIASYAPPTPSDFFDVATSQRWHANVGAELERKMETFVARSVGEVLPRPAVRVELSSARVADAIVAAAAAYDLVVIGTHGRTGLARARFGSVAEAVVRQVDCRVITVRAHAATAHPEERIILALLANAKDCEPAIRQLAEAQIPFDEIGLLTAEESGDPELVASLQSQARTGAKVGGIAGGVLGMLAGVLSLGGGLLVVGPAAVLAAAGSLIGGLVGFGIEAPDAKRIHEAILAGGVLLSVHARDHARADAAARILSAMDPELIEVKPPAPRL